MGTAAPHQRLYIVVVSMLQASLFLESYSIAFLFFSSIIISFLSLLLLLCPYLSHHDIRQAPFSMFSVPLFLSPPNMLLHAM